MMELMPDASVCINATFARLDSSSPSHTDGRRSLNLTHDLPNLCMLFQPLKEQRGGGEQRIRQRRDGLAHDGYIFVPERMGKKSNASRHAFVKQARHLSAYMCCRLAKTRPATPDVWRLHATYHTAACCSAPPSPNQALRSKRCNAFQIDIRVPQ